MDKVDLIDIHKVFHPTAADHTFSSAVHETFYKID
jgi:hypothetical protein